MLAALDKCKDESPATAAEAPPYLKSIGSKWHNNARSSISEFTSACLCKLNSQEENCKTSNKSLTLSYFFQYKIKNQKRISNQILNGLHGLTLSYFCSCLRFAIPPQNREVPRTRRRFESMEPRREYLTTAILLLISAKIAIMSSVAFPHVAFRSPPTVIQKKYKRHQGHDNQLYPYNWLVY